jgi:hypothetical protein
MMSLSAGLRGLIADRRDVLYCTTADVNKKKVVGTSPIKRIAQRGKKESR